MPCLSWCAPPWTCEKIECETCDKCLELSGGRSGGNGASHLSSRCEPWCVAPHNCIQSDLNFCGGCAGCQPSPPNPPGMVAARNQHGASCAEWCTAPYTCHQSECSGCSGCAPNPPPPPLVPNHLSSNPFATPGGWFVNPSMRSNMLSAIAHGGASLSSKERQALQAMASAPSAFWIDTKSRIKGADSLGTLEGVLANAEAEAAKKGPNVTPALCVFVLYNLPHRDCNAKASRGEISSLNDYKEEYVKPFANTLKQYKRVPVVVIIEPDSLGNLVSSGSGGNWWDSSGGCSDAVGKSYRDGISFAVSTLAETAPHAALYIDAGHGGWMGFEENAARFAELIHDLGVAPLIRGFSTNVANYQALGDGANVCPSEAFSKTGLRDTTPGANGNFGGVAHWCQKQIYGGDDGGGGAAHTPGAAPPPQCCSYDPCKLLNEYSGGATEMMYAQTLQKHMMQRLNWAPKFVIDTGRNGAEISRNTCQSWCNLRGAGAGHVPTMNTGLPSVVDAFFYIKTPGESDGCTRLLPSGGACPRFDQDCESHDSIGSRLDEPRAPTAGGWWEYQARELARNSNLRLDAPGALDSTFAHFFARSRAE